MLELSSDSNVALAKKHEESAESSWFGTLHQLEKSAYKLNHPANLEVDLAMTYIAYYS